MFLTPIYNIRKLKQVCKTIMNSFNNTKIKKNQINQQTANIYYPNKPKNRVLNQSINRKHDYDTLKNLTRKSIEINITHQNKNNGLTLLYQPNQSTKPYRRISNHNFKKNTGPARYEEQQKDLVRPTSKSPYVRMSNSKQDRELQGRITVLNKSSQKIKSNQLLKQNSPRYFYRQPRSSLSQHYDPSIETSLHKRKVSVAADDKTYMLQEAKQLYKSNNYTKSIEILKKYVRLHRNSVQGHYLLGMSLINSNEFNLGIDELLHTLQIDGNYKKSLYLVIALAYKRLQKFDQAIQILNKGLEFYPEYYDCLVYRGKLHLKKENYSLALKDFTDAIKANPVKGFAYVGKGSCEKELMKYQQAIQTFSQGLNTDMGHICCQKRGIVYYQQNKFTQALKDLEYCTQLQGNSSSTGHYYKGLIYYKQNLIVQSLLCFQEALKCDNHKEHVTASVEMMMKIKIEQKDFYEAYHILTRADNVEVDIDVLNQWRLFLEASLFLMKKKYKQGISTFQSLLTLPTFKKKLGQIKGKLARERYIFLKPLIHLYKAFGQLCENKSQKAQKQYQLYQNLCQEFQIPDTNLSKNYNKLVMQANKKFPNSSREALQQAIKMISNKPQPYLYLAFDIINNKFQKQSNPLTKNQHLQQAIENLTIGISHLPQLSNNHISTFYYFRSILYLYKNDFNKSVADVDKAIQKSEDNIPKYFYLRGLIFAIFGNFSQAIQDLTVATNLDQKYAKPYLERAKCLQIQGNSNQAFLDLQRYITLAPQDQQIHKYAGYLLFQNCAYEDCLSAFSHGADLQNDYQLILTKAKCHFLLGEDQMAIPLFKKYGELSYNYQYESDIIIMQICRNIKKNTTKEDYNRHLSKLDQLLSSKKEDDCKIFKLRDMHQIKASIYLIMKQYQEAIKQFQSTLKLFNIQKTKEMQKHFIEDSQEFQDQWSQVQIKFNLSIAMLCLAEYEKARDMLVQFEKSSQKGKNWGQYMDLLNQIISEPLKKKPKVQLDTFEQNHRISRNWPKISIPALQISLSMAFSYPFVEPPQLMPEFDQSFFNEFNITKSQNKPQAPWINRSEGGLVFTPNVQIYQNLQLSMTTTKKNDSEKNKPVSDMQKSINMSHSDFHLQTQDLKKKFKLDSLVEMKLKKLMKKE